MFVYEVFSVWQSGEGFILRKEEKWFRPFYSSCTGAFKVQVCVSEHEGWGQHLNQCMNPMSQFCLPSCRHVLPFLRASWDELDFSASPRQSRCFSLTSSFLGCLVFERKWLMEFWMFTVSYGVFLLFHSTSASWGGGRMPGNTEHSRPGLRPGRDPAPHLTFCFVFPCQVTRAKRSFESWSIEVDF